MSGFKLIAIQVLDKCWSDVRKILPLNTLYQFNHSFNFSLDKNKKVATIRPKDATPLRLFDIPRKRTNDLSIDISAIVGKNGSGKSTILELFYAFCLCISKDEKDIKEELEELRKSGSSKWDSIKILFENLHVEIFFESDEGIQSIKYEVSAGSQAFTFNPNRNENPTFDLSHFCYCVALNHSIYGLNEINSPWLTPVFHKNDGYQAPLVINPYRAKGVIDINREYDLANARVIQNISFIEEAHPEIINDQKLWKVGFSFEPKNLNRLYYGVEYDLSQTILYYEETSSSSIYDLFNKLASSIVHETLQPGQIAAFNSFRKNGTNRNIANYRKQSNKPERRSQFIEYCFVQYIIRKTFKICLHYSWFREYVETKEYGGKNVVSIKKGKERKLLEALTQNKSHITLKLRQTLILWKRRYFLDQVGWGEITNKDNPSYFACYCELDGSQIKQSIGIIESGKSIKEQFDMERIPGGILKPEILVTREALPTSSSKIYALSSGEQQFLFTIHTILYHLKNLDSVFEADAVNANDIKKYRNVMIILDEVELYFHPEFQRTLVDQLLSQIPKIRLKNINNINILFSTHSPFILSDIPSNNLLRLKDGKPDNKDYRESFSSNIHELLTDNFFLENGFIGEYTKRQIENLVAYLKSERKQIGFWNQDSAKAFISMVGDDIIRIRLEDMYIEKFDVPVISIREEQKLLENRLKQIQTLLSNDPD